MSRVSILAASLGSTLCLAVVFVSVALAAGPLTAPPGHGRLRPSGLCVLRGFAR
jgi:hypothetical protein